MGAALHLIEPVGACRRRNRGRTIAQTDDYTANPLAFDDNQSRDGTHRRGIQRLARCCHGQRTQWNQAEPSVETPQRGTVNRDGTTLLPRATPRCSDILDAR